MKITAKKERKKKYSSFKTWRECKFIVTKSEKMKFKFILRLKYERAEKMKIMKFVVSLL